MKKCSNELMYEFSLFRSFHLLVERYNDAIRTTLFSLLLSSGVAQVVSAAGILLQKSSDNVPFVTNLFFLGLIIQAALVIQVVYGFCGHFYLKSCGSMTFLRKHVKTGERGNRKRLEMFLCSCQRYSLAFPTLLKIEQRLCFKCFVWND